MTTDAELKAIRKKAQRLVRRYDETQRAMKLCLPYLVDPLRAEVKKRLDDGKHV